MEVFGHVQHRLIAGPNLAADARDAVRACLEVGHTDQVVVAHGVGQMLGRRIREAKASALVIDRQRALEPIDILAAIGEVLVVDDLPEAE